MHLRDSVLLDGSAIFILMLITAVLSSNFLCVVHQDRIRKEYKVDTHLGQLQISYKEMIGTSVERTVFMDTTIGETRHQVTVCLSVHPSVEEHGILEEAPHENTSLAERPKLPKPRLKAIKNGVTSALTRGKCIVLDFPLGPRTLPGTMI